MEANAGEIEIDAADLAEVESALALTEVAIMLDGKGGFDMTQKGKDFEATLNSYMSAALPGLTACGHTLVDLTINAATPYTITYPTVFLKPEDKAALLGAHDWRKGNITYSVHHTGKEGHDITQRKCDVYVCLAAQVTSLPGLAKASVDPSLPPGAPPPGILAKCWLPHARRCRIMARSFMISAGLETAADLRCAFEALNGGSSIFDFKIIGEPKVATGAHGVSGYCLSMWIIAKAPGDQDWDGLLLPCTLLHPETIAVEERGGVKFCQPIYTAPCEKPRAQRVLTDGVNVRDPGRRSSAAFRHTRCPLL